MSDEQDRTEALDEDAVQGDDLAEPVDDAIGLRLGDDDATDTEPSLVADDWEDGVEVAAEEAAVRIEDGPG